MLPFGARHEGIGGNSDQSATAMFPAGVGSRTSDQEVVATATTRTTWSIAGSSCAADVSYVDHDRR